ncbi:hypothetical protein PMAYCL1PPCAC_27353, partial [Pristionchus mayeri]
SMDLIREMNFLEIPLTLADLNKPEPLMVQRLYRTILIKSFGIPESSLSQPDFTWVTPDMQRDPDLYNRSEGFLLLTRFVQSILNDYTNISDDTPQFGVGALVDPKPRETKMYLSQLVTIAKLKQAARPHYDAEVSCFKKQIDIANDEEERASMLEKRLEKLKAERTARLRHDDQLCRLKNERSGVLAQMTRASTETEKRQEDSAAYLEKLKNSASTKDADLSMSTRKCEELEKEIIDDPEQLREEVEELRMTRVEQQRVLDKESRECRDLECREEQCTQAARAMATIEGEMGTATKTVSRLNEATREKNEKQAVIEERQELLSAKKEGGKKKRGERGAFKQRHEEERNEQKERQDALAAQIATIRSECTQLRNLEGAVKKNVLEARQRLGKLRNDKNSMIAELTEYMQVRVALLEKMEAKMAEKQAEVRKLEAAYEEGKENLVSAMTSTDLDSSVTATMQLLD